MTAAPARAVALEVRFEAKRAAVDSVVDLCVTLADQGHVPDQNSLAQRSCVKGLPWPQNRLYVERTRWRVRGVEYQFVEDVQPYFDRRSTLEIVAGMRYWKLSDKRSVEYVSLTKI